MTTERVFFCGSWSFLAGVGLPKTRDNSHPAASEPELYIFSTLDGFVRFIILPVH